MTLANKITVLRIVAIPIFVIALLDQHMILARTIFILSVLSDALDGTLARIRGERTALGSFLDPTADKLLLVATFIVLTALKWIPLWVFITILSRDMIIILGWQIVYMLTGNRKIQPRFLGKITSALQMAVALELLFYPPPTVAHVSILIMIVFTIASALDYIWLGNQRLGELE